MSLMKLEEIQEKQPTILNCLITFINRFCVFANCNIHIVLSGICKKLSVI